MGQWSTKPICSSDLSDCRSHWIRSQIDEKDRSCETLCAPPKVSQCWPRRARSRIRRSSIRSEWLLECCARALSLRYARRRRHSMRLISTARDERRRPTTAAADRSGRLFRQTPERRARTSVRFRSLFGILKSDRYGRRPCAMTMAPIGNKTHPYRSMMAQYLSMRLRRGCCR